MPLSVPWMHLHTHDHCLCPLQTHGLTFLCLLLYPEHTCTHTQQSPCLCRHTHSHTHCLPLPSAGTSVLMCPLFLLRILNSMLTSHIWPVQASAATDPLTPLGSAGMDSHATALLQACTDNYMPMPTSSLWPLQTLALTNPSPSGLCMHLHSLLQCNLSALLRT